MANQEVFPMAAPVTNQPDAGICCFPPLADKRSKFIGKIGTFPAHYSVSKRFLHLDSPPSRYQKYGFVLNDIE
jgi:hypothetical protein